MSITNKVEIVNNLKDKILFFNSRLYKIVKVNTINIYAFEYIQNKEFLYDVSLMFYSIGDKVAYYNFNETLNTNKIKLKVKDILKEPYKIINTDKDLSNIYFIQYTNKSNIAEIKMKDNFKESLFNTDIQKLKDIYHIKKFINNMKTPIINTDNEYYKNIKLQQMANKKYFSKNYLLSEIKELCETEIEFIKAVKYEEYINII